MEIANDLATENPKIVGMFANRGAGKLELDQMDEERTKTRNELLTGRDVCGKSHPALGPVVEILTARKLIQQENSLRLVWGVRYGRSFLPTLVDHHGTDHDFKPVLPPFGIRVRRCGVFGGQEKH